jgi:hypothetical protein
MLTAASAQPPAELTLEEWRQHGVVLARIHTGVTWWLGDWWAYGQHRYGERKALVDDDTWDGPAFQTCMHAAVVCRAFETCRRRDVLSFNHHTEVAGLVARLADELLDWCEESNPPEAAWHRQGSSTASAVFSNTQKS